ncbi:hypothetical protein DFP73DRAFT_566605 [Morchella snyderi]|nr:hypothetical protein DFP73DRAFT_566605 [Morchella snyderi]
MSDVWCLVSITLFKLPIAVLQISAKALHVFACRAESFVQRCCTCFLSTVHPPGRLSVFAGGEKASTQYPPKSLC